MEASVVKVAVIDDWQRIARRSADWSALSEKAEVVFFAEAFESEDAAVTALAEFEIILDRPFARAADVGHHGREERFARC
jgi:hypothetical protein